ncbi:MAG: Ig-like domain-containing protein, partial [Ignavibacteriae bacterium]|nr:Ig-like domain-containing protein [Ignavibacteriota bacterium]
SGANAVVLSGDVNVTMPDTRDSSLSRFTITVRDTSTFSTKERTLNLSIAVSGPNGIAHQTTSGTLLATGGGRTRLPGSIALISTSENEIQVTGTGGTETSTMIFEIRDSLGVPVDSNYLVKFSISPLFGGAFISPDSGYSDSQTGRITSVIHSGTVSGPVQVIASITSPSGTVTSSPVRVLIHSGPPDPEHISVGANPINVAGLDWNQRTSSITAQIGDKYGNPVPQGTVVHFTTDIGIVTTSPGETDANGIVTATLFSTDPRPLGGFGYVKVRTIGSDGIFISDSVRILFSGQAMIDSMKLTPSNITNFTAFFRVYDRNHNVLAKDNTITVTTDGDVSLVVSRVFPVAKLQDTQDPAWTQFAINFSVDINDDPIVTGPFVATITVEGQNGTAVQSFQGRVDISAPPESEVKGLELAFRGDSVITVYDAGGLDYTLIGYQIIDSLGRTIQRAGIPIVFSSEGVPGSFVPETTLTNDNGIAVSTFHSSTVAGNVSIRGSVIGTTIQSIPMSLGITGGKASQQYFTVRLTQWDPGPKTPGFNPPPRFNFPGLQSSGYIGNVRVVVGDKYGNPVPPGTIVTFTTNAGVVTGADVTNEVGLAVANWIGGNPSPPGGIAVIKASVLGEPGLVSDSSWAVYSGAPSISGLLPDNFILRNGIDTVLNYNVEDVNGNPVVSGGLITVNRGGGGANSVVLDGNILFNLPDTRDTAFGTRYQVRIRDTNTTVSEPRSLSLGISHTNSVVGEVFYDVSGTLLGTSSPIPPTLSGIRFVSGTTTILSVKNSGGTETTVLTFEAIDSVGNTISRAGIPISFIFTGVPGTFSAETVLTDNFGRVQAQFRSDTIAGVVQIRAMSPDGSFQSNPVSIVIVGGLPNENHFTFIVTRPGEQSRKVNYPGAMPLVQKIGEAIVQVGDRYGNPAPAGTPVYFGTNAGIVQGTAFTDANGFATVDWFGGNPVPIGGVANVSVTTLGDNGEFTITDTLTYSGQALISGGPANGFVINSGFVQTDTYTVNDANSNPLVQGVTIQVSASGTAASTLVLTGDLTVTMPDTRSLTETQFTFTVRDTSTSSRTPRPLQLTISVDGPNGTATLTSAGTVLPAGAGDTTRSRLPGSIAFISISNTEIQVTGTGGTETTTLLFEVRDSLGIPVDSTYPVKFTFTNSPGGGEFITPNIGYTDEATGQVSAIIHSGTRSGVLQLLASVYTPTDTINSEIVRLIIHGGLPDQTHFSIGLSPLNVSGLVHNGRTSTVTAIVGDKYGNPVPEGTAIYFTSTLGVVTTNSGFTNEDGFASVTLYSGNPRGDSGFGFVKAFTVGEAGATITDSARMLFSGYPNITYSGSSTFTLTRGGSISFTFEVADLYGHPITKGSTIQLLVDSESDMGISAVLTMGDTQVSGPGSTQHTMTITDIVEDPPVDGTVSVRVRVVWEGLTIEVPLASGSITP